MEKSLASRCSECDMCFRDSDGHYNVIGEFSIDFDKDRAEAANEIRALRLEAEHLLSDRG